MKKGPIFDPQCIFWIYLRVREVKNTWVNPLEIFSGRGENFENWQPVLLTLSDWGVPSVGYFLNSQHFHQEPPLQLYKFRQTQVYSNCIFYDEPDKNCGFDIFLINGTLSRGTSWQRASLFSAVFDSIIKNCQSPTCSTFWTRLARSLFRFIVHAFIIRIFIIYRHLHKNNISAAVNYVHNIINWMTITNYQQYIYAYDCFV